ncbi:MAG: MFS transporter [Xanthobacteraceae bacterium]
MIARPNQLLSRKPLSSSSSANRADASLTRQRAFVLFWCARTFTNVAYMMQGVAVGWQLYALTNNPLDLGLVGLVQFFPLLAMSIIAGQLLDLLDRRLIAAVCQLGKALAALALAFGTARGVLSREAMLAILFLSGTARAFEIPTMHSLLPGVIPVRLLPRAIAASASAQQTAVICGPSLGGLLYVLGPTVVYLTCTVLFIIAGVLIGLVRLLPHARTGSDVRPPVTLATMFAGFHYIRANPVVLGAISLDLFAVLLGGVTALLPIYARDILQAGPWALGLLRSAPALGALVTSVVLARRAIERSAGRIMFAAVGLFGVASVLFGLSTSIPLSCLALALYGASDAVSVVIRQSLVQLRTPSDMLGRVMAVNSLCTGSSGTLGEFRAGTVAAWLGPVASVLVGGFGAMVVALVWMWAFPQLRRVDRLAPEPRAAA